MARMLKPGWSACKKSREIKNNSENTSKEEVVGNESGSREPTMPPTRLKTLARATKNEIPAVKAKIKSMLPSLQQTDVRRYKIPHYESMILELEEANLKKAAEYIRKLLQLDEDLKKNTVLKPGVSQIPRLKHQNDLIDILRDGLIISNRANQQKEVMTETAAFLELALEFQSKSSDWWWIAEEFFKSALEVSSTMAIINFDDGQTFTILHYLYGRFLQIQMNDTKRALEHLTEAWRKSRNKNWNASKILGIKQKSVFTETCMLLHEVYLSFAKQLKNYDPNKAIEAGLQALEKAQDSDREEYVADAFYELGKCELHAGNIKKALQNFLKYLALVKRLRDPEGICNAHMQLAFSYKEIKDRANTMKHFRLFKESAAEFQLQNKLADAHYYTGEYLLNMGQPALATPNLEFAVSLYSSLNAINECDRARCVTGVSKGQEIMESYVKLIVDSGKKNSEAIVKLCKWKNNREPFWLDKKSQESEKESLFEDENCSTQSKDTFFSLSVVSGNVSNINNQEKTEAQKGEIQKHETQSKEEIQNEEEKIEE